MKDSIMLFVIGVLVGAVIATGTFYIYTTTSKSCDCSSNNTQMNGDQPPEMPSGQNSDNNQPPEMPSGQNSDNNQPPEKPDGDNGEPPTKTGENNTQRNSQNSNNE